MADDPTAFIQKELWMEILSYVGPGHFAFVAGISKQMKEWYKEFINALNEPPRYPSLWSTIPATRSDTYYSAAFSSVACAEHWKKATNGAERRSEDEETWLVCMLVARNGHLEALKWARQQGFGWNSDTCREAAKKGHLEMLKFAHENGCDRFIGTCNMAAQNGHLECLKYAHESGCEWSHITCSLAAGNGHLECLQYAHDNGCSWNKITCELAAASGSLECLKYAHESGCEWTFATCSLAAKNGHLEILKYAHEKGWDGIQ